MRDLPGLQTALVHRDDDLYSELTANDVPGGASIHHDDLSLV